MNLTEIKTGLASGNIRLTKSLGQNFLHDANQLSRIVDAAEIAPGEPVLEIGPGMGALTQPLLNRAARVLAIEKDRRLVEFLEKRFHSEPRLELIHADALEYVREKSVDWSEWKLTANLPYSVASPIIVELAKSAGPPKRLVVTVQLEVAKRLSAQAGDSDYGVLSLLVQVRYEAATIFKIPAPCFFPVPGVDSACARLVRRPKLLLDPRVYPAFERIVKRGFSQRRKMMLKLLKMDWPAPKLESAFGELGLSLQARAETVTLDQYIQLTQLLSN